MSSILYQVLSSSANFPDRMQDMSVGGLNIIKFLLIKYWNMIPVNLKILMHRLLLYNVDSSKTYKLRTVDSKQRFVNSKEERTYNVRKIQTQGKFRSNPFT